MKISIPVKRDRDSVFLDFTRSICPVCKTLIDAQVLVKENRVIMRKRCSQHGRFETLLSSDAEMYVGAFKFNKPGTLPLEFATEVKDGCPYDCGLCPEHQQHSCVGVIEVTESCNLRCPTCFSNSTVGRFLEPKIVDFMVDRFVKYEGNPEVVMFSGGEPSIHPGIIDIIRQTKRKGVKYVMLNTNGVRIADDNEFVKALAELNVNVYLQFDGFKRATYEALRGEDLTEVKKIAVEKLTKYKVNTVLVCTVQKHVNEDEYGAVTDFALGNTYIRGVVFQPTFYAGRHPDFNPLDRVTLPDVIKGISAQSRYGFTKSDFVPIPCCYPNCSTATYVYMDGDKPIPLPRVVNVEDYMDYIANRTVADFDFISKRTGLEALYSAASVAGSEKMLSSYCTVCDLQYQLSEIRDKVKMILVQPFMDAWNFDIKRLMKCCVSEIVPDGRLIPFCAYNVLYR